VVRSSQSVLQGHVEIKPAAGETKSTDGITCHGKLKATDSQWGGTWWGCCNEFLSVGMQARQPVECRRQPKAVDINEQRIMMAPDRGSSDKTHKHKHRFDSIFAKAGASYQNNR
jgi:hypothetical protein